MAVFRVERNSGYTVMSNHHLRNKELTLKAKGLLSQMLSLPEDWDYTLAGLSHINRESIDAIRTAVWELEKAGYILRRQGRDEKGKMTAIEYTIYEQPQPMLENPIPGIVCTHPDGHNQSGNIHVHIVINSLRIENVPLLPYMDRPADTKAGCKHRCTDAAMEYFKSEVMELCHEAGLYQIDLLNGSANRVTEREYWARKKGQAALDQENAALAAEGKPTKPTRFETDKEKLRQIIRKTLNESFTVEDFTQKLLQYGVTVKESRGRFSYLTPDRTKPITARKLGDSFDKAAVLAALEQNALRPENTLTLNDGIPLDRTLSSNEGASGKTAPKWSAPQASSVGRMVDREAKRAEGKGIGYDRWATMHNLKAWSKTFMYLQEHDLLSPDKLSAAVDAAGAEAREARSRYDAAAAKVTDKKAMLEAMDNYRKTYPVIKEYRAIRKEKDRQKFYAAHEADFIINDAAKRQLDKLGAPKQLPKRKEVVAEIQSLISEKNECYNDYREKSDRLHELMTMQRNYQMAMPQPKRGHSHEQER